MQSTILERPSEIANSFTPSAIGALELCTRAASAQGERALARILGDLSARQREGSAGRLAAGLAWYFDLDEYTAAAARALVLTNVRSARCSRRRALKLHRDLVAGLAVAVAMDPSSGADVEPGETMTITCDSAEVFARCSLPEALSLAALLAAHERRDDLCVVLMAVALSFGGPDFEFVVAALESWPRGH